MTRRRRILAVLAGALAALAMLFLLPGVALAIETPSYRVVKTYADFEVREYAPFIVAETEVSGDMEEAGNQGFRRLAGYIFGANRARQKLPMTAPVTEAPSQKLAMTAPVTEQPRGGGRYVVQFMMPSGFTLETLPEPTDPSVHLRAIPARRVAALRYSGTWSAERYAEKLEQLRAALRREGLTPVGEPEWARYNPPWTPWFLRRNEVLLELAPARE